jgi:group I intron endonuclease
MYRIYFITNVVNGKVYVGLTKRTIETRWKGHIKATRKTYFANAITKHGPDNFEIQEVAQAPTLFEAMRLERFWIGMCQSYRPENGYNTTFGGENGFVVESARQKMSDKSLARWADPEYKERLSEAHRGLLVGPKNPAYGKAFWKGKTHSEETKQRLSETRIKLFQDPEFKQRMSEANTGKHHTEEGRVNIAKGLLGNQYRKGIPHSEEVKKRISESLKKSREERSRKIAEALFIKSVAWG